MIKHNIEPIGQIKTMGCWAAAFAMMYSWKSNSSQSIESILKQLGPDYQESFKNNTGLTNSRFNAVTTKLGLIHEPPSNPTKEKWLSLISQSPLLVIVDENLHPEKKAVHTRIVLNIESDSANKVTFNDPAGKNLNGSTEHQSLSEFVQYFEGLADSDWLGLQIIHY